MLPHPTLFERFGGVRRLASELEEPLTTVQSWKAAGRIPAGRQPAVLAAARRLGLPISAEDIIFPLGGAPKPEQLPQEPDTSSPRHAGVAPRVKAAKAEAADRPATGADLSGEAGSTIICAECERPATDETVRACQFRDCPRAGRWAA